MANQKALFTTRQDFERGTTDRFITKEPYIYFDGVEAHGTPAPDTGQVQEIRWLNGGQPEAVPGPVGQAAKFEGQTLHFRNWGFPTMDTGSLSIWAKFTAADLVGWSILATNRGDGWLNKGFHLAVYNGQLNIRTYSSNMSTDNYTSSANFKFEPDKWYHIALIFDDDVNSNIKGVINGEVLITSHLADNITFQYNSLQIGDMDGGYPLQGTILDEFMYLQNENSWSVADAQRYYEQIANGEFIDTQARPGSMILGKGIDGSYPTDEPESWVSPIIDLGGPGQFVDYGYLEVEAQLPSAATSLSFFSRSSSNGTDWEDWTAPDTDGIFQSTNQRYWQIRIDLETTDRLLTPQVDTVRVLEDIFRIPVPDLPDQAIPADTPLRLYKDTEDGLKGLGEAENAYQVMIEEELKGQDNLSFSLPFTDEKRHVIGEEPVEIIANLNNRYYTIKETRDRKDGNGRAFSDFLAEARWTELREWFVNGIEEVNSSARTVLETVFNSIFLEDGDPECDWHVGHVEVDRRRTLRSNWADVLTLLRDIEEIWDGELVFDTKNKFVHFLERTGKDTGVEFTYEKNIKSIERTINTYDLFTRIYPLGREDLDITTVNNGVRYLENTEWVEKLGLKNKIIPHRWKDERYTVPDNLYEDAKIKLDNMSKPQIAYESTIQDLSDLTGHEHEQFDLGDTITVKDYELFEEDRIKNRVVRRNRDVRHPENTTVEISQIKPTLANVQSRQLDDQIRELVASNPLSASDIQQMTVFNNLINSRGDDEFSSWVHTPGGTEFQLANVGFSGAWSYKVEPDFDAEAQLTQTVEGISHRSTYTVSASVATEGELTRGGSEDAFVGIKVLVYYEGDPQPEVHYLQIPDVTSDQGG